MSGAQRVLRVAVVAVAAVAVGAGPVAAGAAPAQGQAAGTTTERVSVATGGAQANANGREPAISADGRYVAFVSAASNLVPGDTNQNRDVFLRDRSTGTTRRVSVSSDGTQSNRRSIQPAVSADGRFVAFTSRSPRLVPRDTNGAMDVFVRDRRTRTTRRVSVSSDGRQGNRYSSLPAISANGRYVAFLSDASNLVPDDPNRTVDAFVRDRWTGRTRRVSLPTDGTGGGASFSGPAISAGGRYVTFMSRSPRLVPGDTNGSYDVFVRDRQTHTTRRVSVGIANTEADDSSYTPDISADGRYVTFHSRATNLVPGDTNGDEDVFVRDRRTGTTRRVSVGTGGAQANGRSAESEISADGRYVAFVSAASNLVPGDTNGFSDVFVRDRQTGTTRRVSVAADGAQANGRSAAAPAISAHGGGVAFASQASDLVAGDTNGLIDVFVRVRGAQ